MLIKERKTSRKGCYSFLNNKMQNNGKQFIVQSLHNFYTRFIIQQLYTERLTVLREFKYMNDGILKVKHNHSTVHTKDMYNASEIHN